MAVSPASAHESNATLNTVSREDNKLVLDVRAPLDRYDFAYGTNLASDPADFVAAAMTDLGEQLETSVTLSFAGAIWTTTV